MMQNIETVIEGQDRTGEAPTWDAAKQRIVWVDAERSLVFDFSLSRVAGIALNRSGGMIFAGATGLHLWYDQGDYRTIVSEHEGESLIFNDIVADAQGRIYAGTYYWGPDGMEKTGKLYLIEAADSVRVMDEGIKLSNGLGFSPDNRTLYYADSGARRIYAYDVDQGTGDLTNRRDFVEVLLTEGIPDGLAVDADGYVWSAQWYGGQVVRYDPDGNVERRIEMPVQQVSSVIFGGPDLTDLYITTAGEYWPSNLTPPGFNSQGQMGGSLYCTHLDVPGKPEHMADF